MGKEITLLEFLSTLSVKCVYFCGQMFKSMTNFYVSSAQAGPQHVLRQKA